LTETVCGNATALPFADGSFDCVFIGYGLRNFPNLNAAVREIERVTRPGGLMVSLDFFLPGNPCCAGYFSGTYMRRAHSGACCLLLHGNPHVYT
jgi:ubiquinone/menaquinone biosynthesis C-methylase UbiE